MTKINFLRLNKTAIRTPKCFGFTFWRSLSESSAAKSQEKPKFITVLNKQYETDSVTNVTPRVLDKIGQNLHNQKYHPLYLIRKRIENFFYSSFLNRAGNPLFSVYDNISPVVSLYQNFDSLLVPADHVSRSLSDSYYISKEQMLRAHTSAHEEDLIKMGLDAFLVVGDVYRRDEIDSSHYPVFHQMEGVRLFSESELFSKVDDTTGLSLFENTRRTADKQETHTMDAAKLMEYDLKNILLKLARHLFGKDVQYRWVDCYFPFTHPSWELEIWYNNDWLEVLGSGILEQKIVKNAGASAKVGWAFGLGLERLAMKLYEIPDIRLFWSKDPGFLNQFKVENPETSIKYKPVSEHPPCINDVSFWIPQGYNSNDFYDISRDIGGDSIEQILLIDQFTHPKTQRTSHCYRIVYRHMDRTLTNKEVNEIHEQIEKRATEKLNVEIR